MTCGGGGSHFSKLPARISNVPYLGNIIDRKLILASTSMFPGSRNPKIWQIECATHCFPHQNGPWDATLWNVVAIAAI